MTETALPQLPFPRQDILDVPPLFQALRESTPITRVRTPVGDVAWLVTGYSEAKALFADTRLGRAHPDPERAARVSGAAILGGPMGDFDTEAEDHALMRKLLAPAFSARRIRTLQGHIKGLVDGLLDRLAEQERPVDLHEALSFPLPVLVICEVLGVPYADRDRFRRLSEQVAMLHDREAAKTGMKGLGAYMVELIAEKRREPSEDVISDLLAAQEEWGFGDDYIAGIGAILLFGGHETTVAQIDYGTLLLLANPGQFAALRADPSLAGKAVEEILRVATPGGSGAVLRYAGADIDIAGGYIRRGDAVLLAFPAANRDPDVFPEPDAFDISRSANAHLTFGHGARYCIGAGLARVELQAVFGALPRRFPTLKLAVPMDEVQWRSDMVTGGLAALPVSW
jgi:pentalenolactone synthase